MAGTSPSDLDKPLGQAPRAASSRPWSLYVAYGFAGLVSCAVTALALTVALRRDPDGGRPVAEASIERRAPAPAAVASAPQGGAPAPSGRNQQSARDLEGEAGVTVVRPGAEAPGAIVITVPDEAGARKLAPAPDSRLVERTRFGQLPKVGADGATSMQVYARPEGPPPPFAVKGRIALLVGGLGISQSGTADAVARLPGAVSLAFAPYGSDLERTVQRARGEGHEVLLQVPMEPFDYPDNDPGPHTLLTGPKSGENIDRLRWVMGRFTGYVGIVNFLGGRLTSDEAALTPVLREVAGRGLMVVDDGSSARSLLAGAAVRAQIPALKIDRTVDAVPQAAAIDAELKRLETQALESGLAIGAASALPLSIARIEAWAKTLEAKGIDLVPLSAARARRSPTTTGSLR